MDFHDCNLVYTYLASLFIKKDSYILLKNKNIYISLNLNFVSLAIYLPLLLNKKKLNVIAFLSKNHPDDTLQYIDTNIWCLRLQWMQELVYILVFRRMHSYYA